MSFLSYNFVFFVLFVLIDEFISYAVGVVNLHHIYLILVSVIFSLVIVLFVINYYLICF